MFKLFWTIPALLSIVCTVSLADDDSESAWERAQRRYYQELRKQKKLTPAEIEKLKKEHQEPGSAGFKKIKGVPTTQPLVTDKPAISPGQTTGGSDRLNIPSNPVPDADKIEREVTYGKPKNPKPVPSNRYQVIEVQSNEAQPTDRGTSEESYSAPKKK